MLWFFDIVYHTYTSRKAALYLTRFCQLEEVRTLECHYESFVIWFEILQLKDSAQAKQMLPTWVANLT